MISLLPSANVDNLDENIKGVPIVTKLMEGKKIQTVMSNSFGFWWNQCNALIFKDLIKID